MASIFDQLTPDLIFSTIEEAGFIPTGEYTQLNSYENRVFDLRLETSPDSELSRVIAKFYRPQRWSRAAIEDEHRFLQELSHEGIPAIAPLQLRNKSTLVDVGGFLMAVFPRVVGQMPQEFLGDDLKQIGRTLAQIHNVGARHLADHRPTLDTKTYGWNVLERLERFVYPDVWPQYREAAENILDYLDQNLPYERYLRIHGDCHRGNLLHNGKSQLNGRQFFFVDFDDFCNGPEVQDFWMLLSGSVNEDLAEDETDLICEGYNEFREIPDDWHLFEPLRALRIISYGGWIAQRWEDTFFKKIFPDFESFSYWSEEALILQKISYGL